MQRLMGQLLPNEHSVCADLPHGSPPAPREAPSQMLACDQSAGTDPYNLLEPCDWELLRDSDAESTGSNR